MPRPDPSIWRPQWPVRGRRRRRLLPRGIPTVVTPPPVEDPPPNATVGPGIGAAAAVAPTGTRDQFFVEDVVTGIVRSFDLPLEGWENPETLNRPGALNGRLPLTSSLATHEMLDPWRTAIYRVRGGNIEWGGILTPPQLSVGDTNLQILCTGWPGYFDKRIIRSIVGQPEAGGVRVFKPSGDVESSNVFGNPDRTDLWKNVAGSYAYNQGAVSSPSPGDVPQYLTHFDVPTGALGTLHPIVSVTLGIVASALGSPRALTPILKIGGTIYNGAIVGTHTAPADGSYTWTTNPATGLAWTVADVEAFTSGSSGGFFTDPNATGYDTVVNQIWLTVNYAAGFSDFFTQTDQFDIVRQLVLDAQSQTKFGLGYDLGIDVVWDQLSGVLRDRIASYTPSLAKNLGEALRQLAAVGDGFDFAMEYQLNPTTNRIDKALRLFYPRKGRETGLLFEYERGKRTNVTSRGFADPVDFAWAGDGWGTGNDQTRLRTPYVDDSLRGIYPPYDAAPSWSEVSVQSTLDENTRAAFARSNRPKRVPVLRVNPDMSPKRGEYELGDVVSVRINDGYGSTDGVIPERYRITGTAKTAATFDLVLDPAVPSSGSG